MATIAGNIGFKVSSRLQLRGLLIPWASKSTAILCVKGRDYSSSIPIRYIPKRSAKIKESENNVPVKGLERNEWRKQSNAIDLGIEVSDGGKGINKPVKVNESKNSVLVSGLERDELCKQSDASKLIVEVSDNGKDVKKYMKTSELEDSGLVNGLEYKELSKQSDASEWVFEFPNSGRDAKEQIMVSESENQLPVNSLEGNEACKSADKSKLKFEVSNIAKESKKCLRLKESVDYMPVNGSERNRLREQLDSSMVRIEVSNSGREINKSSRTREPHTSVTVNGVETNVQRKHSDPNQLRIKVSDSRRDVKRIFAYEKKFQHHNQTINASLSLDDDKQGFREETDCEESEEEPWKVVKDMKIHRKTMQDAENVAIKLLGTRAFTAVEMRKKLSGKKFSSHVIDALITDFQSRGLINDSLYAESYSRSRWSSASWGPRRIKQALFSKGISQTDANKAVNLVFKDGESDEDEESKLGMSKHSIDHLFSQASKQWLRSQDAPMETRKSRIIRWLQYRGFNWSVTSVILKKLESQ